jgi:DNA mismatch endonuclease (patch repair protein)
MPDVFTKAKRSEVMSRIRSRGNKDTELVLAQFFRRHHITGWRRHLQLRLPILHPRSSILIFTVRPDFVFRQSRLAIFVDGCFWHGCPKHGTKPKGNAAFWRRKITGNQTRDRLVNRTLRRARWRVLRLWEHTLRQATTGKKHKLRLLKRLSVINS